MKTAEPQKQAGNRGTTDTGAQAVAHLLDAFALMVSLQTSFIGPCLPRHLPRTFPYEYVHTPAVQGRVPCIYSRKHRPLR